VTAGEHKQAVGLLQLLEDAEGPLDERSRAFCSEATLVRYLRARDHDDKKALAMLRKSLAWRRTVEPEILICKSCQVDGTSHSMRGVGVSKNGHPVFYSQFTGVTCRDPDQNVNHLIFKLENAFKSEHVTAESFVWVIDFAGFSRKDLGVGIARQSLRLFQDQYPERLGCAFLLDAPVIFAAFWKIVKPWIDAETLRKVRFLRLSDIDETLSLDMAPELVERIKTEVEHSRDTANIANKLWWTEPAEPPLGGVDGLHV